MENYTNEEYYYNEYYYYQDNNDTESYPKLTQVVNFLELYYVPVIITVGVISNALSFVVFVFTPLKRLSLSVYLAALAVADIGFLCALSLGWLDAVGINLVHRNGWCQMTVFTSYVCSFLSAWLVVSFTVERYIAICYPLKRREMCTVWRAKVVVGTLVAVAVPGYAVTLKITVVKQMGRFAVCQPLMEYGTLYRILTYVDAVLTFVVPCIGILVCNVCIVYKIAYYYGRNNPAAPEPKVQAQLVCLRNRAQVRITKMLLVISTVFLVVNLPSYAIRVMALINSLMALADTRLDILLNQLFQHVFYTNFAINFFLYNICSKKFREALRNYLWQINFKLRVCCRRYYNNVIRREP